VAALQKVNFVFSKQNVSVVLARRGNKGSHLIEPKVISVVTNEKNVIHSKEAISTSETKSEAPSPECKSRNARINRVLEFNEEGLTLFFFSSFLKKKRKPLKK